MRYRPEAFKIRCQYRHKLNVNETIQYIQDLCHALSYLGKPRCLAIINDVPSRLGQFLATQIATAQRYYVCSATMAKNIKYALHRGVAKVGDENPAAVLPMHMVAGCDAEDSGKDHTYLKMFPQAA